MNKTLRPGITSQRTFLVPVAKTVPALYPESEEFLSMPEVFATGYLVGFVEWACIEAINPYLDWPREQTLGVHVNISHEAPTPPGLEVTAQASLVEVDGRRLVFDVEVHDVVERISHGRHERFIITRDRFDERVEAKRRNA